MTNDDKKKVVAGVVAGAVALGGAYLLYRATRGSSSSSDEVAWQAPPQQAAKPVESPKKEAKAPKSEKKAEAKEASKPATAVAVVEDDTEPAVEGEKSEWPDLGISLGDLGSWAVATDEDGQTIVSMNNSAILRFLHEQYSPMLGGQPLGNFLVEDQSKEHYTNTKECSEANMQRSMQADLPDGIPPQMAEMLRPRVVKSAACEIGPFDWELVYDQQGPGMFIRSRQLQKLHEGILYTWQVAGPPQLMEMIDAQMEDMAKAITLNGRPEKATGTQVYTSAKAKAKLSVPFHWVSGRVPANLGELEGLISWDTNAENPKRRDEIKLYTGKAAGEELAKIAQEAIDAKAALTDFAGVWTFNTRQGSHQSQVYVKGPFVLQVIAAGDSIKTAPQSDILDVISSVSAADGEDELRAYSPQMSVSFKVAMGSTLVESNWVDPQLTYTVSREDGAPNLIIAMPQSDPNKPPPDTIQGWYDRIEEEFPQTDTSSIESKNYETVAGQQAVAFVTREMVPAAGMGMFTGAAEEQKAKMYVLMHNTKAYLIRYATVTGEFRRLENTLKTVIGSLKFEE